MSSSREYSDFAAYTLNIDGTFNELEMEQSEVSDYLDPEEVLLLILTNYQQM